MIRRPPRSTQSRSSAASDVYKRQLLGGDPAAPRPHGEREGETERDPDGAPAEGAARRHGLAAPAEHADVQDEEGRDADEEHDPRRELRDRHRPACADAHTLESLLMPASLACVPRVSASGQKEGPPTR